MAEHDIGLIGLAVMGQNLALNMARNGYRVAVYNRSAETTEQFAARHADQPITGAHSLPEFVALLRKPRIILLMVKAGAPVDSVIDQLIPLLETGDLIIDGGNSHFEDTERREARLAALGIRFLGVGVSGGEEGALHGPSLMPGGAPEAYALIEPLLRAIAAKAPDGAPCVAYLGRGGAGHYVKMVHNGIEYGDMQLIAESYDILKRVVGLSNAELADVFAAWNQGELDSFLIAITAQIFRKADDGGRAGELIDYILDAAEQKGTGKWTSQNALDLGVPTPTLSAAVEARLISALKAERRAAAQSLSAPPPFAFTGERAAFIEAVRRALYCSKVATYAQGMALLSAASREYNYAIPLDQTAAIWRAGCIIRARFLSDITRAYQAEPH
ncbi:MAG: NADP-dependent phosphogluconate dehydrogenase, partial [Aggregatilineales bacterium]